jgi:acyl-CoA dehydrogenase
MDAILSHLLTVAVDGVEVSSVPAWWARHGERAGPFDTPVDRAMAAALSMDRLGWAFASGYQEALRALVPDLPPDAKVALCATERGGNHPRAIETALTPDGDGHRLHGHKRFTTLGTEADLLLVVVSEGLPDPEDAPVGGASPGKNRLAVVRVGSRDDGVHLQPMPDLPFIPEVPHAEVRFDGVRVGPGDRLPGDGYARYLKPFRTVEDAHVHAAVLAWLLGTGRRLHWPHAVLERLTAGAITARALARAPTDDPAVHVALAGLIGQTAAALEATEPCWQDAPAVLRTRWDRDRALLGVAATARQRRTEAAWARLRGDP